ncbi:hypothetical protein GC098_16360 [Paenibacillus sp. LMG 31458]|uniref:Uncharacterized protein n=1 Tax=Paenibacillus phytorum TaxID=2654977 RepID=A0ABX1XX68_9BACL|nr:hypothetical protein [Paenibacillus phytorum]NOU72974.1 hypothetical protein [Paenibacillus phytorum]
MKAFLNLTKYKKCRLWINDYVFPERKDVGKIIDKSIPASMQKRDVARMIAIEVSLPRNMSNYALVGFEFIPDTAGNVTEVSVFVSSEQTTYSYDNLALSNNVFSGIPDEFAQSVLESAIETIKQIGGFSPGKLIFNIGAFSDSGSSIMIFRLATSALIKISQFDIENMSDNLLQDELETFLTIRV